MRGLRNAVAVLLALAISGCGISTESQPRALDPGSAPFRDALSNASPAPTGEGRVLVYLVRDQVLVAVTRRVPLPATPQAVLQALLSGPSDRELEAGLTSAAPREARLATSSEQSGIVLLEVPAGETSTAGRSDEVLGFGQLVVTLTSMRGVTGVRFVRDGLPLSVPRSDGQLTTAVLVRKDYSGLL